MFFCDRIQIIECYAIFVLSYDPLSSNIAKYTIFIFHLVSVFLEFDLLDY